MKLRVNKKLSLIILPLVLAAGSFIFAPSARADWAADILTGLLSIVISALGLILVLVIQGLVLIASYQHFIDSQAVILGWVIVRDICNMFFVVILMVIAFGTILNIPDYSYKKWLPKLILFAVLINFSKTICGLLIDVTQVVMLTFVNAFKDIGGANLTQILGITEIVTMEEGGGDPKFWTIVGAYVLGLIYLLVAIVVIVTMAMILAMRLVMIWIYVVLSPAAYLLSAVPGGQKYASQWWDEFIKNLIVGPVLAFFIWLSLAALTADTNIGNLGKNTNISGELNAIGSGYNLGNNESKGDLPSKAGQPGALIKFLIGIGMLVGGLMVSQQIGGAAGKMAGSGINALQKGRTLVGDFAKKRAKSTAFWAGRKLDTGQMAVQESVMGKLGVKSYRPKSMNVAMIKKGWEASSEEAKNKYYNLHGGAANNWHDTFNKYTDIRQYGSVRKNLGRQTKDNEAASELEAENVVLGRRKRYTGMNEAERRDEVRMLEANDGKERIDEYFYKAPKHLGSDEERRAWAQEQYDEDRHHLEMGGEEEGLDLQKKMDANVKQIDGLRDVRTTVMGKRVGFSKTHRAEPIYGTSGDKEKQKKDEQEMSARTNEDNFALVSELLKAYNEKDSSKMAASFNLLAKNNDLNEALKDNRIAHLMTKTNGILETMAKAGTFGAGGSDENAIKTIKADYGANRVTPAYLQTLIQGMFDQAGTSKDLAGRYANQIGHTSFANGNGIAYAMADGNASSGEYEFSQLEYKGGKVRTSDARRAIITGKFNTMESQTKARVTHPDTIISEDADGNASGITDEGEGYLRALKAHDLNQLNRFRSDLIKKVGNSRRAMSDLVKLVEKLEDEGNQQQADYVKYFTWYINQNKEGKGLKDMDTVKSDAPGGFEEIRRKYD